MAFKPVSGCNIISCFLKLSKITVELKDCNVEKNIHSTIIFKVMSKRRNTESILIQKAY